MEPSRAQHPSPVLERVLAEGGETGALIRSIDWSESALGPIEEWPPSLCYTLALCLGAGIPMTFGWGPELVQFYNDAAIPLLRDRHPAAMGSRFFDVWGQAADVIEPTAQRVLASGRPVTLEDAQLPLDRGGGVESAYFTFSFSAVRDEHGQTVGLLNTFIETTRRVLGERRMRLLREVAARTSEARSAEEACSRAAEALATGRSDLAFALVYLCDGETALLSGATGLPAESQAVPSALFIDSFDAPHDRAGDGNGHDGHPATDDPEGWPLAQVARTGRPQLVTNLEARFGPFADPDHPAPESALVLPVTGAGQERPVALLVAGIARHRPLDDDARDFLQLVAASIGTGVVNARAHESALDRAERLADLDRAKTTFISNISHEFRTPITLILGPVEELLARPNAALTPQEREQLATVRRNGLRLWRLVDDLLTITRIETGRLEATFAPTDLSRLTRDLTAMFDSAATRAGLRLVIDCPPLPEPVYVDPELWEKIILNLLSNALKFTFVGEIEVSMRAAGERARLTVRDTGVGIAASELPHIFERFYRIKGTRARTHEGAGIGLALLRELARLHGGDVAVESMERVGSMFTVEVPFGSAHLPPDKLGPAHQATANTVAAPVEEAQRWTRTLPPPTPGGSPSRPRILVVEDNADMREYLSRLLHPRYEVVLASDGKAALTAIRERLPNVVLSDVMMPRLDGLQLVSRLREDVRTRAIPIVLLSARTGEEATLDGLGRGADDYVVKPFSARELVARIDTHLELARIRNDVGQLKLKDEFMTIVSHELVTPLTSMKLVYQFVRERLRGIGAPEAELLARLDRALARMEHLVEDLLTSSRLERRSPPALALARSALGPLCAQAAEEQSAATGRLVTVELPPEPVYAVVDPDAFGHVVSNLIGNALKFSAPETSVRVALAQVGDEAMLSVADEGPGIPPGEQTRVFDRYYRVPYIPVRSGSKIGFGLGLYISKAIVERHQGRMWVESTVGRGSTFFVALPSSA